MNPDPAQASDFDPRPALRDGIVELCGTLVIRLEMVRGMADLGDDIGLAYAFRCFRAEAKAMAGNVRDLCELLAIERHAELGQAYAPEGEVTGEISPG